MTLDAHPIGVVTKLQRRGIGCGVRGMRIVARAARGIARAKALRPFERLDNERRGAMASVPKNAYAKFDARCAGYVRRTAFVPNS
jgi:hypothetical protein